MLIGHFDSVVAQDVESRIVRPARTKARTRRERSVQRARLELAEGRSALLHVDGRVLQVVGMHLALLVVAIEGGGHIESRVMLKWLRGGREEEKRRGRKEGQPWGCGWGMRGTMGKILNEAKRPQIETTRRSARIFGCPTRDAEQNSFLRETSTRGRGCSRHRQIKRKGETDRGREGERLRDRTERKNEKRALRDA